MKPRVLFGRLLVVRPWWAGFLACLAALFAMMPLVGSSGDRTIPIVLMVVGIPVWLIAMSRLMVWLGPDHVRQLFPVWRVVGQVSLSEHSTGPEWVLLGRESEAPFELRDWFHVERGDGRTVHLVVTNRFWFNSSARFRRHLLMVRDELLRER